MEDRLKNLEIDHERCKLEMEMLDKMVDKHSVVLERLSESQATLTKILAVHEEKLVNQEHNEEELYNLVEARKAELRGEVSKIYDAITSTKSDILTAMGKSFDEIKDELKTHKKRISRIEIWRWLVLGGSGVIIFILLNISSILEFLRTLQKI